MTISDESGAELADYFEFVRQVPRRSGFNLRAAPRSVAPGTAVRAWLRNPGTETLAYGLGFDLQRKVGRMWLNVPRGRQLVPAIRLFSEPGIAASCWAYTVPADAPPGIYRFSVGVERFWNYSRRGKRSRTAAVFRVLPQP